VNCKPDDLAIIVKTGKGFEECIGRIVKTIEISSPSHWEIEFVGPVPAIAAMHKAIQGKKGFDIPDAFLRPITGLPVDDGVKDEVPA
jgi:hypothetical protein